MSSFLAWIKNLFEEKREIIFARQTQHGLKGHVTITEKKVISKHAEIFRQNENLSCHHPEVAHCMLFLPSHKLKERLLEHKKGLVFSAKKWAAYYIRA